MTLVEYIREKGIQQTHIEHFISPPTHTQKMNNTTFTKPLKNRKPVILVDSVSDQWVEAARIVLLCMFIVRNNL